MQKFEKRLSEGVLVGDGAMGTMLYEQGIFINRCFEELNVSNPQLVKSIHREYVCAGVDFIKTNTFGANRVKLAKFGIAEKVDQINSAAVEIAKNEGKGDVLIGGSIGPTGLTFSDLADSENLCDIFAEQACSLYDAGVDFIVLETFTFLREIEEAISGVTRTGLPIAAHLCVDHNLETECGRSLSEAFGSIDKYENVKAVGLNCHPGPAQMLNAVDLIKQNTDKHISLGPNTGLPRKIDDRSIQMCTPEYFTEYAKKFFQKGVKIISGCCGTTPGHIGEAVKAIKPLEKSQRSTTVVSREAKSVDVKSSKRAVEDISRLGLKLSGSERIFSIEISPPRGNDISRIIEKVKICRDNGIEFVNIPDGPRASSRLSAIITAIQIQQMTGVETIAHYCCRDKNLISIQSELLGLNLLGINNVLAITGDPPKLGDFPFAAAVYDIDSIELTRLVNLLNIGIDVNSNKLCSSTRLTVGVGANPAAIDVETEIERLVRKIDNGADYIITQPVFSTESFVSFFDKVRPGIPVIAGVWPFTSFKNAQFMASEVPGVVVPEYLLEMMGRAGDKAEAVQTGIEISRKMMAELSDYVGGFAVSAPFGNVDIALSVIKG